MNKKLIIIGGTNIDIVGTPLKDHKLALDTSNIGNVLISVGGVGKNIAYNLRLLEGNVNNKSLFYFITSFGNSPISYLAKNNLEELKIDYFASNKIDNAPIYLAINNNNNDLFVSLCDNKAISSLDRNFFENEIKLDELIKKDNIKYMILDGNLSLETISYLIEKYHNILNIIVEGVSIFKVIKFKDFLDKIYLLKCNNIEIIELYKELSGSNNCELDSSEILKILAEKYRLRNAIVTNKAENILVINDFKTYKVNIPKNNIVGENEVVSSNGVGDSLLSAFVYNYVYLNNSYEEALIKATSYSKEVLLSDFTYPVDYLHNFLNK